MSTAVSAILRRVIAIRPVTILPNTTFSFGYIRFPKTGQRSEDQQPQPALLHATLLSFVRLASDASMKSLNDPYSTTLTRRRYEVWFLRLGLSDGRGAWWFRYLIMNPGRNGC